MIMMEEEGHLSKDKWCWDITASALQNDINDEDRSVHLWQEACVRLKTLTEVFIL